MARCCEVVRRKSEWRGGRSGGEGGRKKDEGDEEGEAKGREAGRPGGKSNEDTSSYPRRCGTMARSNLHQGWTYIHRPTDRRDSLLYASHTFPSPPVMRAWIIIEPAPILHTVPGIERNAPCPFPAPRELPFVFIDREERERIPTPS